MFTLLNRIPSSPSKIFLKPTSHYHKITTTTTPPPPSPSPPQDATTIANLILKTNPQTLDTFPIQWTPELVDQILKRLWNHGPKALHFFKFLDHHPTYVHSSSAFDHAIDIAARLRDFKTLWTIVARMRSRRLGPSPKTFAIITESFESSGTICGSKWKKKQLKVTSQKPFKLWTWTCQEDTTNEWGFLIKTVLRFLRILYESFIGCFLQFVAVRISTTARIVVHKSTLLLVIHLTISYWLWFHPWH